jgi:hypothetical protein
MDAPFWELVSRALVAVIASVTCGFLVYELRVLPVAPVRPLLLFLTAIVGSIAAWRVYVLWVGFQSDFDGSYMRDVEPLVRVVGQVQLSLLLVAVGLLAFFHTRRGLHD